MKKIIVCQDIEGYETIIKSVFYHIISLLVQWTMQKMNSNSLFVRKGISDIFVLYEYYSFLGFSKNIKKNSS